LKVLNNEDSIDDPVVTGRSSFTEVIQEGVLRKKRAEINRRDQARKNPNRERLGFRYWWRWRELNLGYK
jgi:hypothetical protein